MLYSLKRMWALLGVVAAIAAVAASSAVASHKAGPTIVIWTDSDRAAAVTKVANDLVEPIFLSSSVKANFPSYTLNAFSYGTAVKKLYGVPAAVENIGLVVNTKLAKVPTSFSQLETEALAVKKAKHQTFGIAVKQGSGG